MLRAPLREPRVDAREVRGRAARSAAGPPTAPRRGLRGPRRRPGSGASGSCACRRRATRGSGRAGRSARSDASGIVYALLDDLARFARVDLQRHVLKARARAHQDGRVRRGSAPRTAGRRPPSRSRARPRGRPPGCRRSRRPPCSPSAPGRASRPARSRSRPSSSNWSSPRNGTQDGYGWLLAARGSRRVTSQANTTSARIAMKSLQVLSDRASHGAGTRSDGPAAAAGPFRLGGVVGVTRDVHAERGRRRRAATGWIPSGSLDPAYAKIAVSWMPPPGFSPWRSCRAAAGLEAQIGPVAVERAGPALASWTAP